MDEQEFNQINVIPIVDVLWTSWISSRGSALLVVRGNFMTDAEEGIEPGGATRSDGDVYLNEHFIYISDIRGLPPDF